MMEDIQKQFSIAAKHMVEAYEFTGSQKQAIDYVQSRFNGIDTLTLIAMWKALDAWDAYAHPMSHE